MFVLVLFWIVLFVLVLLLLLLLLCLTTIRLCGTRGLHPYRERLFVLSTSTTVRMTSDVALTGPGLQLRYSLFNLSERRSCPHTAQPLVHCLTH